MDGVKARVGDIRPVGIDGLTLALQDFTVNINQGAGGIKTNPTDPDFATPNSTVVDFAVSDPDGYGNPGLLVITGPDPDGDGPGVAPTSTIDLAGADGTLLEAAGKVTLGIQDFFFASGGFAFSKKRLSEVALYDTATHSPVAVMERPKNVDLLTIGALGVTAFTGVNGPYWSDLDADGAITPTDHDSDVSPLS